MVPSTRAIPLAAIFLVAFFAGIPSDPTVQMASAQGDEDEEDLQHFRGWSIGDFWRYDKRAAEANNANTKGEVTYRVQSAERVTNHRFFDPEIHDPDWKHNQVFRVKVWANQSANSGHGPAVIKTEQERYYRTKDLGLAQTHASSKFLFAQDPTKNGGSERFHEYYPPQIEMMFPFAVGDKWRAATLVRNHNPGDDCGGPNMPACNTTSPKVHTYTVAGTETLSMTLNGRPQEIFTYRIHVLDELGIESAKAPDQKKYEIWWWSPEACNVVLKEEFSSKRTRQNVWTLQDYQCQGRDAADPTYASYDFQNLSSIRRDGKLAVPERLAMYQELGDDTGGGGALIQIGENLPAPCFLLVAFVLVAVAGLARRRD